jgi:hypothetical protein
MSTTTTRPKMSTTTTHLKLSTTTTHPKLSTTTTRLKMSTTPILLRLTCRNCDKQLRLTNIPAKGTKLQCPNCRGYVMHVTIGPNLKPEVYGLDDRKLGATVSATYYIGK